LRRYSKEDFLSQNSKQDF